MYKTFLWQDSKRQPYYRIQTNDPSVARKLRRRKASKLALIGINKNIWVFRMTYKSPAIAYRSLSRITGQKVQKDANGGELVAYTTPKLTFKSIALGNASD